jgi:hypothetical protein
MLSSIASKLGVERGSCIQALATFRKSEVLRLAKDEKVRPAGNYGKWLKEASSALSRSFSKLQHDANKRSVSV